MTESTPRSPSKFRGLFTPARPPFWIALFVVLSLGFGLYDAQLSRDERDWKTRGDFTRYTFAASRVMLAGGDPYDRAEVGKNYKYFPLNAVVVAPLTPLPIPAAQGIWIGLNVVLLLAALRSHRHLAGASRVHPLVWIASLAAALGFIAVNIQLGQWNLAAYSLTILGLTLIVRRPKPWLGGLVLGLAAGVKFMPAFFALYFLVKRRYRAAAAILLGAAFWVLVFPSLVLGPKRHFELLDTYLETSRPRVNRMVEESISGHSVLATVYAYLTPVEKGSGHGLNREINVVELDAAKARRIAEGVCLALALATLGYLWWQGPTPLPGPRFLLEIGMVFMLLLMISPEARKAQFLTVFTSSFALAYAIALWPGGRFTPKAAWIALAASYAVVLLSSKVGRRLEVRGDFLSYGGLTVLLLMQWATLGWLQLRGGEIAPKPEAAEGQAA
jgi:hypothetical protein